MPYCPVTRVLAPIFGQVHLPWSPAFLPSEATLRAPACPQRLRSPFSGRGNRSSGARAGGGEERGGAGRAGGRGISCVTEGIGCTTGGDNGDKWWRRGLLLASLVATRTVPRVAGRALGVLWPEMNMTRPQRLGRGQKRSHVIRQMLGTLHGRRDPALRSQGGPPGSVRPLSNFTHLVRHNGARRLHEGGSGMAQHPIVLYGPL